jgi:hypothetical protein
MSSYRGMRRRRMEKREEKERNSPVSAVCDRKAIKMEMTLKPRNEC